MLIEILRSITVSLFNRFQWDASNTTRNGKAVKMPVVVRHVAQHLCIKHTKSPYTILKKENSQQLKVIIKDDLTCIAVFEIRI